MSTKLLTDLSKKMLPAVEAEMRHLLNADGTQPDWFDGMIHYHMGWADETLKVAQFPAGKRIRPLLCLLCCLAAGGDWEQAVPAGASIEILHNFTLVHDDIQDKSPLRRGRPTVWQLWGENQAINTGDAMFAQAHLAMSRLLERGVDAGIVVQAIHRLDETCLQLTRGQHADMDFETRDEVTVSEYLQMIDGKTAALLALAAELGALIAGKSAEIISHYAQFARYLGLAFQVRDDILGVWGDEEAIGKSAATDIETRKKCLPVLYGLGQSQQLRALYAQEPSPADFVAQAVGLLDQVGAQDFAVSMEKEFTETALAHMDAMGTDSLELQGLVHYLLGRQT